MLILNRPSVAAGRGFPLVPGVMAGEPGLRFNAAGRSGDRNPASQNIPVTGTRPEFRRGRKLPGAVRYGQSPRRVVPTRPYRNRRVEPA